jgi:hypothetical protein
MQRKAKLWLEILEDRNAPGNLSYLLSNNPILGFKLSTPKSETRLQLDRLEIAECATAPKALSPELLTAIEASQVQTRFTSGIPTFANTAPLNNKLSSFANVPASSLPTSNISLNDVQANIAMMLTTFSNNQRELPHYTKASSVIVEDNQDRATALSSIVSQMSTRDIGIGGEPPPNPSGDPWEEQEVMINGNNDHGAPMVTYTGTRHIGGQPAPQPNTITYPGYVPVNYEYDYKAGAQSITANPRYSDPQVVRMKLVPTANTPIPAAQTIKWKLTYTAPADGIKRLRFWDSSSKLLEFQPNNTYEYTAPLPPVPDPLPTSHGMYPAYVEGIEMSKALKDAGEATLSLEYTLNNAPSVFVHHKPIKFTVAPVISSLQVESEQPKVYLKDNQYTVGPRVKVHADFATKSNILVTYVQFVNSIVNLANTDGTKAVVKKLGSPTPDLKWDYGRNYPNPSPAMLDSYLSQTNFDFAFLDALPGEIAYPQKLQGPDESGNFFNRMTLRDDPGAIVTEWVETAKFSVIFDTYTCIVYPDPSDVSNRLKDVFFPTAKVSWKYTVDASNFSMNNGILTANYGPLNSVSQNGASSIYIHQFSGNQKLTGNVAFTGYPLMPA